MTAHSTKQESLLSSESGRLVARSQFDFHHIIEQWVQENGMNNHSKRRKERLIEDGHVIREAIEYGEGENENRNYEKGGRDVQMNKSVYHLNSMLDNKSFRKRDNLSKQSSANEKLHSSSHIHGQTASGLVNASKSSQKEMLSSKRQGQKVKQKSLPFSNKTKSEKIKNKSLDGQRNSTVDSSQVLLHTETLKSKSGIDEKQLRNTSNSSIPVEVDGSDKAAGGAKVKQRSLPQSVKMSLSDTSKNTSAKPGTNQAVAKRAADIRNKMPSTSVSGGKKTDLTSRKTNVASNSLLEKESDSEKNQDIAVRIVSVDSHGQVIRYVKQREGKLSKSNTKLEIPLVIDRPEHSDTRAKEIDFDSDPKYAHLPAVVRKKLANIHKDRLNKIKFLQVIRKRCKGRKYCLSNVRADERYLQNKCFHDAIKMEQEYRVEIQPCKCSMFRTSTLGRGKKIISLQSKPHPRVALVSLPGSGNTWVRGLLEQATGYCTGSMWCDPILRAKQFCAEGVRANTLVVKNHDSTIRWVGQKLPINSTDHDLTKPQFNSAIFVHRNPYEATIAEWNRALGFLIFNASRHNQTVAGIGVYNASNVVDQHTITFGKEAFGKF